MSSSEVADFSIWLREHEVELTRAARAICFDIQNAPDVLQEALADVYQRWKKLRNHENLVAYTIRVMISKHADIRRSTDRKRSEKEISLELVASLLQLTDGSDHITERMLVQAGIASLSAAQRAVLLMYYDYGFSIKEIAHKLALPAGTIASHLARGRSAVAEYIQFSPSREANVLERVERVRGLDQGPKEQSDREILDGQGES
jgi:RNA polymerase sigma-70 factor (ECF subfamily)